MGGILMPFYGAQQGYVVPSTIPNLSLWYNASASSTTVNTVTTNNFDVVVTNGTKINSWIDLSGAGHASNVNGGTSNKPTYTIPIASGKWNGLGAVQYTASATTNLDINPISWAQNLSGYTMYVVAMPTTFGATAYPLVVTETSMGIWYNGTNWSVGLTAGNAGTVTLTNSATTLHMYGFVFDGTQTGNANRLKFRFDKIAQTLTFAGTIPTTTSTPAYMFFGGDNRTGAAGGALASTYMDGFIGEVLIWTRLLTDTEIIQVESYLSTKWAIL